LENRVKRIEQVEDFASYLSEVHQVDCTAEEIIELEGILWAHCNSQRVGRLAKGGDISGNVRADLGKAAGFIFGAILGVLFLPALLGVGVLAGALLGGAIGYRLVGMFDGPGGSGPTGAPGEPLFAFGGAGSLAKLNSPIPIIYANKDVNPSGGIYRRDPALIHSAIRTELGAQKLIRVSLLAYGRLGRVNAGELQLDDQPLANYNAGDIIWEISSGLHNQPALDGITNYSQAVAINSNGLLGLSPGIIVGDNDISGWQQDSAAVGSPLALPAGLGSSLHYIATNEGTTGLLLGLHSSFIPSPSAADVDAAIVVSGNNDWELSIAGVVVAAGSSDAAPVRAMLRVIRSHPGNYLQVVVNRVEVYRAETTLNTTLYPVSAVPLLSSWQPSYISRKTSIPTGDLLCGYGTRFALSDAGLSKIRSTQTYRAGSHIAAVVGRNAADKWIELGEPFLISDQAVESSVVPGTKIIKSRETFLTIYRAVIATSKEVTALELTLKISMWAKTANGDELIHAQAFDLAIEDAAGQLYPAGRFLVSGSKQQQFFRGLRIGNLPRGMYKIRLTPIPAAAITAPIATLSENSTVTNLPSPGAIGGQAITLAAELGANAPVATAVSWMSFENKPQHADQAGPSIQVSHLNEIVDAPVPPAYPGYTIARTEIIASDRIQNAAAESWMIEQGQIVRCHLFARTLASIEAVPNTKVESNLLSLLQVSESFASVGGMPVGAILRILGKGSVVITHPPDPLSPPFFITTEARPSEITTTEGSGVVTLPSADHLWVLPYMHIAHPSIPADAVVLAKLPGNQVLLGDEWGRKRVATATGQSSPAILNPLPKATGHEDIIIYQWGSSSYFPDLFVDRLINPISGLGNSVNADYFIDYKSIVDSRKFCIENKFFYDGVIAEGSFEEWAVATAPASLLYPTLIEGKYALLPQRDASPSYLFTDANSIEFRESDTPYSTSKASVVLVKYQNNLGRERQVRISTQAASSGEEEENVRTIDAQGVTSRDQAIKIGQVALKSLRLQTKSCEIKTDVASGLYTRQGDIVRSQHVQIQYCNESSGFALAALAPTDEREAVIRTIPILMFSSGYIDLASPHEMRRLGINSILPSDQIEISGIDAAIDGIYGNTSESISLRILSDTRLFITSSPGISSASGTLKIIRRQFDQVVSLSERPVITPATRITIGHRAGHTIDADRQIQDLGDGQYKITGLDAEIKAGDNYATGEASSFERVWRITSIKPDVASNSVGLTGILWDPAVLSPEGLVVS
jgi:hypothetical protein